MHVLSRFEYLSGFYLSGHFVPADDSKLPDFYVSRTLRLANAFKLFHYAFQSPLSFAAPGCTLLCSGALIPHPVDTRADHPHRKIKKTFSFRQTPTPHPPQKARKFTLHPPPHAIFPKNLRISALGTKMSQKLENFGILACESPLAPASMGLWTG